MFEWMAWTMPVAVFFISIVLMLLTMTVWEIKSPTVLRKGFLPIETTRGDRLFIGLLSLFDCRFQFTGFVSPLFLLSFIQISIVCVDRQIASGLSDSTQRIAGVIPSPLPSPTCHGGWRCD